jgi:serine/threonine protein kinase
MTVASTTLASVLADLALAHELAPWPCPAYFGPSTPPPAPAPHRYILVELIASGPRSLVYRALDTAFSDAALNTATPHTAGRPVIIKINPHHTDAPLEALAVARVKHPNVVRVLDAGLAPPPSAANDLETPVAYATMEPIDGRPLSDLIAEHPSGMRPRRAARLAAQIAAALQAIHAAALIHCDLKPDNILVDASDHVTVLDLDLARWSASTDARLRGGQGNLAYMAPERVRDAIDGEAIGPTTSSIANPLISPVPSQPAIASPNAVPPATPAADIYALGGILCTLLTGQPPHGSTHEEIRAFHAQGRQPDAPSAPAPLRRIIATATAANPADRYYAAALADDLNAWLDHRPQPHQPRTAMRSVGLWIRRNPLAALVAASLLIGAPTATILQARRNLDRANEIAAQVSDRIERHRAALRQATVRVARSFQSLSSQGLADTPSTAIFLLQRSMGPLNEAFAKAEAEQIPGGRPPASAAPTGRIPFGHLMSRHARYGVLMGVITRPDNQLAAMSFLERNAVRLGVITAALEIADAAPIEVARQELARLRAECKGVIPDTDATWSLLEIYAIAIDAADPARSTLDRAANRHRLRTLLAPALPTEARDAPLHAVANQSQMLTMLLHDIANPDAEPIQPVITPESTSPQYTPARDRP